MESNVYKGLETDFSYFVTTTLQNRMPWKMLSSNLFNLAPTFGCKTCSNRFKTKGQLKVHEMIHTGEVPYECKNCKKRFSQICNLKKHERIHTGEVPFECKTCQKRFRDKCNLKIHERIHTGEEPYECKTCGKTFKLRTALIYHFKMIHQSK